MAYCGQKGTNHELCALDLCETGEVLNFVGGGELSSCSDAEGKEAFVHDSYRLLMSLLTRMELPGNSRFRSARAAYMAAVWPAGPELQSCQFSSYAG